MARKSQGQRLKEVHALALQQFDAIWDVSRDDRQLAVMCRRFAVIRGAQWDWDEQDQFANRIKMEINLVQPLLTRIKNEYRQNRIAAVFSPGDHDVTDDQLEAIMGRFRHDTMDSRGRQARDNAFDEKVDGGFGGMRLRAEYENEEKGYQKVCLEPIFDAPLTLFFDANSRMQDKSDARHAFLLTPYSQDAFEAMWPGKAVSWPDSQVEMRNASAFSWFGNGERADVLFVAEYYVKEAKTETWRVFVLPEEMKAEPEELLNPDEDEIATLLAQGYTEAEPIQYECDRVHKYLMSGAEVLEDCGIIAGREIPLIPDYAHRAVIEHRERFWSPVVPAMDAQIAHNLQVSRVAEVAAMPGIRTPIVLDEALGPYHQEWLDQAVDALPFLRTKLVVGQDGSPVPAIAGYFEPPQVPQAVGDLMNLTAGAVSQVMGTPENAEKVEPDMSGKALEMIQTRVDMRTVGYIEAHADAERRLAEVWLSMTKDIYVEEGRKLRTKGKENQRGTVEIGRKQRKNGETTLDVLFEPKAYEVTVDVGPSSATRRAAIVRTMVELMGKTEDPQMRAIFGYYAIMHYDGEGMGPLREYARKQLVALGVEKPTAEDEAEAKEAMAAQGEPPPDPQAQLAGAMAAEAEAKAVKAQADTALAVAKTQQTEAETAETLAGIPLAEQEAAIKAAQAIREGL